MEQITLSSFGLAVWFQPTVLNVRPNCSFWWCRLTVNIYRHPKWRWWRLL